MVLISCQVTPEMFEYKKNRCLKWQSLIYEGMKYNEATTKLLIANSQIEQLQKDISVLKAQFQIRGKKLAKYMEKYGVDEEIMFKIEYKTNVEVEED